MLNFWIARWNQYKIWDESCRSGNVFLKEVKHCRRVYRSDFWPRLYRSGRSRSARRWSSRWRPPLTRSSPNSLSSSHSPLKWINFCKSTFAKSRSMWPDVGIKSSQIFPPNLPKRSNSSFNLKCDLFKITQNVSEYLGYFCTEICHQELSKIAQSGHTDSRFGGEQTLMKRADFVHVERWK